MDKLTFKMFLLIQILVISQLNTQYVQATFMRFTNISCESKDNNLLSIGYCYRGEVNRLKNFISLRYMLKKPLTKDIFFHMQLLIKSNGWKPFLYALDIDLCRYLRSRYNAIAKMLFGYLVGHTNINHSCPFTTEKYLTIDNVMNTDVSKKLRGIPLSKAHYALFTSWSYQNVTRSEATIYFEIVND